MKRINLELETPKFLLLLIDDKQLFRHKDDGCDKQGAIGSLELLPLKIPKFLLS